MSLVDASYGSDDDDDDDVVEEADVKLPATTRPVVRSSGEESRNATDVIAPSAPPSASAIPEGQSARGGRVSRQGPSSPTVSAPPTIRLPDVSELLGPSASDPPTTSGMQKKRPALNGPAPPLPRAKIPRGNLHPARVSPDTAGGLLTPPQLRGRSNVATEDLDKIFSRKLRR